MIMKKFRPKVVNGGYICSYCGKFVYAQDDHSTLIVFNRDSKCYETILDVSSFERCPHCSHVLIYEIQEDLHLNG
jgi:predicted  nucleic acid-binding Zn-ribbon protein